MTTMGSRPPDRRIQMTVDSSEFNTDLAARWGTCLPKTDDMWAVAGRPSQWDRSWAITGISRGSNPAPSSAPTPPPGGGAGTASCASEAGTRCSRGRAWRPLFHIISGKVKIGRRSPDGRENLLTIRGPRNMFGELSSSNPARGLKRQRPHRGAGGCPIDRKTVRRVDRDRPERAERFAGLGPPASSAPHNLADTNLTTYVPPGGQAAAYGWRRVRHARRVLRCACRRPDRRIRRSWSALA